MCGRSGTSTLNGGDFWRVGLKAALFDDIVVDYGTVLTLIVRRVEISTWLE